jgi:hypothetical protein
MSKLHLKLLEIGCELTVHSEECCTLGEVFQFCCSDICTSASEASEKILNKVDYRSFIRHQDIATFTRSVGFFLSIVIEKCLVR